MGKAQNRQMAEAKKRLRWELNSLEQSKQHFREPPIPYKDEIIEAVQRAGWIPAPRCIRPDCDEMLTAEIRLCHKHTWNDSKLPHLDKYHSQK